MLSILDLVEILKAIQPSILKNHIHKESTFRQKVQSKNNIKRTAKHKKMLNKTDRKNAKNVTAKKRCLQKTP